MFREPVSRSMLDSGDAYGRHYQHNASVDLAALPDVRVTFGLDSTGPDPGFTLSVCREAYPFLLRRLVYDDLGTQEFLKFCREAGLETYRPTSMADWLRDVLALARRMPTGPIIPGKWEYSVVNTYNHDTYLSQTLQYVQQDVEEERPGSLVVLQVHGGCDVRGGYTEPRVFKMRPDSSLRDARYVELVSFRGTATRSRLWPRRNPKVTEYEPDFTPRTVWSADDGGTQNLCLEHPSQGVRESSRRLSNFRASRDPGDRGNGKLYIDPDGNGYCPLSGGLLEPRP